MWAGRFWGNLKDCGAGTHELRGADRSPPRKYPCSITCYYYLSRINCKSFVWCGLMEVRRQGRWALVKDVSPAGTGQISVGLKTEKPLTASKSSSLEAMKERPK